MELLNLQLFGGRGGSSGGGCGWGGQSVWRDNGVVVDMDEYMDVLRTVKDDDAYSWNDKLNSIKWIWDNMTGALSEGKYQITGPSDNTTQSVLNGMSINMQDDINYSNTLSLNTLTFSGYRDGTAAQKYKRKMADYLQNVTGSSFDYDSARYDAQVIKANPNAVRDLARKGEKTIMSQPDSYKKYLALEKKITRSDKTGKTTLSDAAYQKYNELYETYGSYQYSDRYKKRYDK